MEKDSHQVPFASPAARNLAARAHRNHGVTGNHRLVLPERHPENPLSAHHATALPRRYGQSLSPTGRDTTCIPVSSGRATIPGRSRSEPHAKHRTGNGPRARCVRGPLRTVPHARTGLPGLSQRRGHGHHDHSHNAHLSPHGFQPCTSGSAPVSCDVAGAGHGRRAWRVVHLHATASIQHPVDLAPGTRRTHHRSGTGPRCLDHPGPPTTTSADRIGAAHHTVRIPDVTVIPDQTQVGLIKEMTCSQRARTARRPQRIPLDHVH